MPRLDELLVAYPKGMRSELEELLVARVAELEKQVEELQAEVRRVEDEKPIEDAVSSHNWERD